MAGTNPSSPGMAGSHGPGRSAPPPAEAPPAPAPTPTVPDAPPSGSTAGAVDEKYRASGRDPKVPGKL